MKTAIYPGSFDPITLGHLNIIRRAANIFDRLIVCVMVNAGKNPMFTLEEREALIRRVTADLPNVEVDSSSELLAGPLAKIFVGYDAGLLALTIHGMKLYSISFILSGFNIFGSAFFTALNNGTVSAAISFLRTLLFQVVSILTLPLIIGVDGIWLAVVAAEAMALVCTGGFVVRGRKKYGYL